MTRLATIGFEWGINEGSGDTVSNSSGLQTDPVHGGTYSAGGAAVAFSWNGSAMEINEYHRFWFQLNATPSSNGTLLYVLSAYGGGASIRLYANTNRTIYGEIVGVGTGSASTAVPLNEWHYITFRCFTSATAGQDQFEWFLDGTKVGSTIQGTGTNATAAMNNVTLGSGVAWTVDDYAVNNSSGSFENSYPRSDTKTILLRPSSDVQAGSWAGGGGGTSNLYDALNNVPPVGVATPGSNTSQIRSADDTGDNATDEYRALLQSPADVGVGASDTLVLIHPMLNHGEEVATGIKTASFGFQANPSDTYAVVNPVGLTSSATQSYPIYWTWSWGNAYDASALSHSTQSTIALRKTDTGTRWVAIDALGAYLEYAPALIPDAPVLSSATPGNQTVDLVWTTPNDNGNAITNYEVWRSESTGTEVWVADVGVVNTWQDTGRTNGTQYFYKVLATNSAGDSALSNELNATPVLYGVKVHLIGSTL